MLPKKIYLNYVNENDEEVTWSKQPVSVDDCEMQNREYTDLSQVWHTPYEEPEEERQVVAIDEKGIAFSGVYRPFYKGYTPRYAGVYWNAGGCLSGSVLIYRDKIVKWAYIEDLLPNNITNN